MPLWVLTLAYRAVPACQDQKQLAGIAEDWELSETDALPVSCLS
jgi:hypothetical protein